MTHTFRPFVFLLILISPMLNTLCAGKLNLKKTNDSINKTVQYLNSESPKDSLLVANNKKTCPESLYFDTREKSILKTYQAKNRIETDNNYRIDENVHADIVMKAGRVIVLKPNTVIKSGNNYLARIESCKEADCEIMADYAKFFTPNSDGINDYWGVKGLEDQSEAKIFIFDRFGKLLKQLLPDSKWDGTFNSRPMPTSSYWFRINYKDCEGNLQQVRSHFLLKR